MLTATTILLNGMLNIYRLKLQIIAKDSFVLNSIWKSKTKKKLNWHLHYEDDKGRTEIVHSWEKLSYYQKKSFVKYRALTNKTSMEDRV